MRAYDIALFTFIFVFMLSAVQEFGIFEAGITMSDSWDQSDFESAYTSLNESIESSSKEISESNPNYFFESIKLGIQAIIAFTTAFAKSTVLVPELFRSILNGLGMTHEQSAIIGYPLGVFVWMVYIVGVMQLSAGRSMKDME